MKILFVTTRFPFPPLKGDQIIAYNRIRMLSKKHKITLLSFYEREDQLQQLEEIKQLCEDIHLVKQPKSKYLLNVLFGFPFSKLPIQVLIYRSKKFQAKLDELLDKKDFDLAHGFLLRIVPFLEKTRGLPVILELIDSMQLNLKRRIKVESKFKKWLIKFEYNRICRFEKGIKGKFAHYFVVSEKDREFLPFENLTVNPLGVDTDLFAPENNKIIIPTIIFSGNMGYAPNSHAINWFVKNCFPLILEEEPNVQLIIAGGNPGKEILYLNENENITVTGFVDSMPHWINKASIAIAPMQSGSGMQNKILEAMACGLPVVTTTTGLGSINARIGEDIIIADSPVEFANTIITLLKNNTICRKIGQNARAFVIENHSWESSNNLVNNVYKKSTDFSGSSKTL